LVAVGTATSAFWILSANSWMQTPAGYTMKDGIAYPADWWAIVFNPSFPYRLSHMLTAAYLTTSLVVLAVGARYLLVDAFKVEARTMMRMGVGMLAVLGPVQLLLGDQHGLNTLEHQPAKIAGLEAHWRDTGPADLVLFALPDEVAQMNRAQIAVPHLGSLILTHSWNGRVPALEDFAADARPRVTIIFFAFRVMVGIGVLLITLGLTGAFLWKRGQLFTTRWYLRAVGWSWPLGFIAILSGWLVTENGRQPYIVYGILRTDQATSPVATGALAGSLTAFVLVYGVVFSIGIYYIRKMIRHGPQGAAVATAALPHELPNQPLASARESVRESRSEPPAI
jgi:cytochrome d ubiquinol oxidase subunit I